MIPRLSVIPPKVFSDNQKAKKKGKDDKKANHLVFLCHIDQIGQSLDQANQMVSNNEDIMKWVVSFKKLNWLYRLDHRQKTLVQVEKLFLRVRNVRSLGVLNICTLFNQFKNWTGLSHVTQMSCKDTLNFY